MKEFIEKLIGRLEEYKDTHLIEHDSEECLHCSENEDDWCNCRDCFICVWDKAKAIVKELAEKYNNGWIPCSERLPQESEPVGTLCEVVNVMLKNGIVTSGWCNRYLEKWYVLDHVHDYPLPYEYKDVIAWHPLPKPYKPQESEWKNKVMKHFTKVE